MTTTSAPVAHTEWRIDELNLDAYLRRIGQPPAEPSAEALRHLHEAHVRAIPFENIDPAVGRTPRLDLPGITAKLVHQRRGGYCYEHGLLFAAVLERLGYQVSRRSARVQPDRPGPRTHMSLVVQPGDGLDYLADVGFGAGVLSPMPLRDGTVVDQAGWPHRLVRDGNQWRLEKQTDDGWVALHAFDDTPQYLVDYEVANHYVATHPNSPFTGRLVVMRLDYGVVRRLVGRELHIDYADGRSERVPVTADELGDTLRSLDIEVDADGLSTLRALHDSSA